MGESPDANLAHSEMQKVSMEETVCHAKYVKHIQLIKWDTWGDILTCWCVLNERY